MSATPPDPAVVDQAIALAKNYQSTIDAIQHGRYEVAAKLHDYWNDWYNALMAICFGLGGGLIAVAVAVHPKLIIGTALLWSGAAMLLLDGLYILLMRKQFIEKESTGLLSLGYEVEYYALVARNAALDATVGVPFNEAVFVEARDKLLDKSLGDLDAAYEAARVVDKRMDTAVLGFVLGLLLVALSAVGKEWLLEILAAAGLIGYIVLAVVLRALRVAPKRALAERDVWLQKVVKERRDLSARIRGSGKS